MALDRLEAEPTGGSGERVEGATHVDWFDAHIDANTGGETQHEATTRSSRRSVSSSKCSSSSIVNSPQRTA